jgi:hypothetical protein
MGVLDGWIEYRFIDDTTGEPLILENGDRVTYTIDTIWKPDGDVIVADIRDARVERKPFRVGEGDTDEG